MLPFGLDAPDSVALQRNDARGVGSIRLRLQDQNGTALSERAITLTLAHTSEVPSASSPRVGRALGVRTRGASLMGAAATLQDELARAEEEVATWLATRGATVVERRVRTDGSGLATVPDLAPGVYAWVPRRGVAGTDIDVASGRETEGTARLERDEGPWNPVATRMGLLEVIVVDTDGNAVRGAGLSLAPAGGAPVVNDRGFSVPSIPGEFVPPGSTFGERPFDLTLPAGSYAVSVYRPGYVTATESVVVRPAGSISRSRLVLRPSN